MSRDQERAEDFAKRLSGKKGYFHEPYDSSKKDPPGYSAAGGARSPRSGRGADERSGNRSPKPPQKPPTSGKTIRKTIRKKKS